MTASRVLDFPAQSAPAANPVNKLRVLEKARRLICEGELPRNAMFVVQYLGEITDRASGAAVVELNTIAERIGTSRVTVVRALRKLVDVGLVERDPRRAGKRCFANAYRLVDARPAANRPQVTGDPTPGHRRPPYARGLKTPSPDCLLPDGPAPAPDGPAQLRKPAAEPTHPRRPVPPENRVGRRKRGFSVRNWIPSSACMQPPLFFSFQHSATASVGAQRSSLSSLLFGISSPR